MKKISIFVIGIFAIIVVFGPLLFVEFSISKSAKNFDHDKLRGKNSKLTDVAIIYNYKKQGRRVAVVNSPITYVLGDNYENASIVVPPGYKTDFASLPSFARLFFNPFGEYSEAAIVHDWLYAISEEGKKKDADVIYYQIMIEDGVSPVLASYFYAAVRLGTLFNNGGYNNVSEWENGFYSIDLQSDYPRECLPEKPDTALFYRSVNFEKEFEIVPDWNALFRNALSAMSSAGYNPYTNAFIIALEEEECQIRMSEMLSRTVQENFPGVIEYMNHKLDDNDFSERIENFEDISKFHSLSIQLQRQSLANLQTLTILNGYYKTKFGKDLPEEAFCIPLYSQAHYFNPILHAEMLGTSVINFVEVDCGSITPSVNENIFFAPPDTVFLNTRSSTDILAHFYNDIKDPNFSSLFKKNDPIAMTLMALIFYKGGFGIEQNYDYAFSLSNNACLKNVMRACVILGTQYLYGHGVDKNPIEASKIYKWTCNKLIAVGCHNYGMSFYNEHDYTEALTWLVKGCELGARSSCNNLGYMYANGLGEKDNDKAKMYYNKACELEHPNACGRAAALEVDLRP